MNRERTQSYIYIYPFSRLTCFCVNIFPYFLEVFPKNKVGGKKSNCSFSVNLVCTYFSSFKKNVWRQVWNNIGYRLTLKKKVREFPGSPAVRTPYSSAGRHGFVWSLVRELGYHTHTHKTKKLRRSILLSLAIFKLKEILQEKSQFPKMSEVRLLMYTKFSFKDVLQWKTFGSLSFHSRIYKWHLSIRSLRDIIV